MCFNDTFCFSVGNFLIWRLYLNHHNWTKEQSFEYLKSIGGEEEAKSLIDELYPQKEKN